LAAEGAVNPITARRKACRDIRRNMADYWYSQSPVVHATNGDEQRYPSRIANYSKSLPHNEFGEVNPDAYNTLLRAVASGKSADYEAITLNSGAIKLTSPQCGLAFDMEGVDSEGVSVPPPPALASRENAAEMTELYWMALLRD